MAPGLELWSSCKYLAVCDGSADARVEVFLDDNRSLDPGEPGSGDEEVKSSRERLTILRKRGVTTFHAGLKSFEALIRILNNALDPCIRGSGICYPSSDEDTVRIP